MLPLVLFCLVFEFQVYLSKSLLFSPLIPASRGRHFENPHLASGLRWRRRTDRKLGRN